MGVPISEGANAKVSREVLELNEFGKTHALTVAVKTYRGNDGAEYARKAYDNYLKCKRAGLNVLATVRINELDGKQLVMTVWSEGNSVAVFSANEMGRPTQGEEVNSIQNIRDIVVSIVEQVNKAAEADLYLTTDAFMVRFKRGEHDIHVDVTIIDTDLPLDTHPDFKDFKGSIREWNIEQARDALKYGIGRIPPTWSPDYSLHQLTKDEETSLSLFDKLTQK